jgi:dethiobiotin synthetase
MSASYFVTGTDTGVGKTTVAAGILAALRRRGHSVRALKPAETGCVHRDDGNLLAADAILLGEAAGAPAPVPFRYTTPAAPAVAARIEGVPFDIARVEDIYVHMAGRGADLILVEGAGGLLVPYTETLLAADLAKRLALPLLVVARASLGTINHTLLTIAEARRRDLRIAGVILNRVIAEEGPDEKTNASEIERLGQVRVIGTVEHIAEAFRRDVRALGDAVEAAFDPASLLTGA